MTHRPHFPTLTLASKVTITRLLAVPVFVIVLVYYHRSLGEELPDERLRWAALLLFLLIALTDALDGYLARSRNEITPLGKIIDPIADKALLVSGLVMLTRPELQALQPQLPIWFTGIAISRDVFLVLGAFVIHHLTGHVEVHPRISGKVCTFLQMLCIVLVLVGWGGQGFRLAIFAAAGFTGLSWLQYLFDGFAQLEQAPHPGPPGTKDI